MTNATLLVGTALLAVMALGACDETIDHTDDSAAGTGTGGGTQPAGAEASFPVDVATAYCEALFACGGAESCMQPEVHYNTEAECAAFEEGKLDELQVTAAAAGMAYNASCVTQLIETYGAVSCLNGTGLSTDLPQAGAGFGCQPYTGDVPIDAEICWSIAGTSLSNCDADGECRDDYCAPWENLYDLCFTTPCGADEHCVSAPDGEQCVPQVGVGQPCHDGESATGHCGPGSFCSYDAATTQSTCQAQVGLGEACDGQSNCLSYRCGEAGTCIQGVPVLCNEAPNEWLGDM